MEKSDLINVEKFIRKQGVCLDLISLRKCKPWCFVLHGKIDEQLSTTRSGVWSKKQVVSRLPVLCGEIFTTCRALMVNNFSELPLPPQYGEVSSLEQVFTIIGKCGDSTEDEVMEVIFLCLELVHTYRDVYENTVSDDERLLLSALIYILYEAILKIAKLTGASWGGLEVRLFFNDCDRI